MTDILKEKIIIRAIKIYKNREEWTDEYVQGNYADAIEYMKEYFDKLFPRKFFISLSFSNLLSSLPYPQYASSRRIIEFSFSRMILSISL